MRLRQACGLDFIACSKPGFARRHALLTVDYGSADALWRPRPGDEPQPAPHGVAHFLEHRLFDKGDGDISARFTALGADVDAHTSFTSTAYSFTCSDRFEESLALLLELVLEPHFTEAAVDRERDIITREIELYDDSVDWVAFNALMRSLYGDGAMGDDIAGTPQSLERIDVTVLEACYRDYYRPPRMSLVVAGDLDADAAAAMVDEALAARSCDGEAALPRPAAVAQPRRETRRLTVSTPRLLVAGAASGHQVEGLDLLRLELSLDLGLDILFGPSSAFYDRHYRSGLVDDETFGYDVYCEPTFTFCTVGGDTPEPARLEDEIAGQVEAGLQGGLIDQGFERSRRRSWGNLVCRYEEVDACAAIAQSAAARRAGVFDYFEAYEGLQAGDVIAALSLCLASRPWGVATVLPRREDGHPQGEDE